MKMRSILDSIGNTPLLRAQRLKETLCLKGELLLKLEGMNPAGSVKDRVALAMVEDAEARGELREGMTIIEPTSGNTGVGLAAVCAVKGYELTVVMPESMSVERRALISAYGAKIVLTDGKEGMQGAISAAEELAKRMGGIILGQFTNPANPSIHFRTTGPEIWRDAEGCVDAFVAGVGTGGTISGAGRFLKEKNPAVYVVAVEPAASPVLSEGRAGKHGLQGIGAGFVPKNLDVGVYDAVADITEEEAYDAARLLARTEGVLCGISSGAALAAAIGLARDEKFFGKRIVVLLPDTGERYLSTSLFGEPRIFYSNYTKNS